MALAVVERVDRELHVRHLERLALGTSYAAAVATVAGLAAKLPGAAIAIDATGVGRAVAEMLEAEGLTPFRVTITGGKTGRRHGYTISLPQLELLRPVVSGIATGRLRFARGCRDAKAIVEELRAARLKLGPRGRARIDAGGKGHHGDLIFAVALAALASCAETRAR